MTTGPVESKVKAATLGAALAGVIIWSLETYVFHATVPLPVQAFVDVAVPALAAFACGWKTRHTGRTDADAQPPNQGE